MNPREFLDLAGELSKRTDDEAALRSAVSRSYYAVFNFAKHFIERHIEKLPKKAEAHKTVYFYLNNCAVPSAMEMASNLDDLRNDRNEADYNMDSTRMTPGRVVILHKKAGKTYKVLKELTNNNQVCTQIVTGIKEYKQKTNM